MIRARLRSVSFLPLVAVAAACSAGAPGSSLQEESVSPGAPTVMSSRAPVLPRDLAKEAWRRRMSKTPVPEEGCFVAVHPSTQWMEVPCGVGGHSRPPSMPRTMRTDDASSERGGASGASSSRASEVAGRLDPFTAATVPSGTISWAEGSFPDATGLTGETFAGVSNDFSLQLNTQLSLTNGTIRSLCHSTATPLACSGWAQFVYWGGCAEIWYFLINAGGTCPSAAWQEDGSDCYIKAPNWAPLSGQAISNLVNMTVTGVAGGATDTVIVTTGPDQMYAASNASLLDVSRGWTYADFNVLGDGTYGEAIFNPGTTLGVQVLTDTGNTSPPTCEPNVSSTGESNDLAYVHGSCCAFGGAVPGILFTESNVSPPPPAFPCPTSSGCGGPNQPCCVGQCTTGFACAAGSCVPCGASYQPCCIDSTCNAGLGCFPTSYGSSDASCMPLCGGRGQTCCAGSRCNSGLACKAVSVTVDGHRLTTFECE